MADEPSSTVSGDDLGEDLEKKYDPERLLKIMSKRAGKGEQLEHSVRHKYEKKFGVDLGHIRIITGEFAEEFNKKRNAYAVTVGSTGIILMGNSPDRSMATAAGQALLAHEVTHVAQAKQGLHRSNRGGEMAFAQEHEAHAEAVESEVLANGGSHDGASGKASAAASKDAIEAASDAITKRVIEMAYEAAVHDIWRNGGIARRA